MKLIYISASYARKEEAEALAARIHALGQNIYEVVSSWHTEPPNKDDGISDGLSFDEQKKFAKVDLEEVEACDLLIALTEGPASPYSRGGRHVEFGYALALGKDTWVIGPTENIFHTLSDDRFPANGMDPVRGTDECVADLWDDHCESCIDTEEA